MGMKLKPLRRQNSAMSLRKFKMKRHQSPPGRYQSDQEMDASTHAPRTENEMTVQEADVHASSNHNLLMYNTMTQGFSNIPQSLNQ